MNRPSFQFYPADWRGNAKLRRCSEAARGAWMDVMCCLHDAEEYGVLRWPLADIAKASAVPLRLLKELAQKGVLKGSDTGITEPFVYVPRSGRKNGEPVTLVDVGDGPCWYSSRMVKDEHVRHHAGASTRFQKNTTPPTNDSPSHSPSPRDGERQGEYQSDGSSSSSSSSYISLTADSAAVGGNELKLEGEKQPPKPSPKAKKATAADPRFVPFRTAFEQAYHEFNGRSYTFTGAKDGVRLAAFLKANPDLEVGEFRSALDWCRDVAASDPYARSCVKQTSELAAFCAAWNSIAEYFQTYAPRKR